jgi:hypothetical protein
MVYIPALEAMEARRYRFSVGDEIGHITFWIQYDETDGPVSDSYTQEYPLWANTRGIGMFISSDPEFGEDDYIEPSEAFWKTLAAISEIEEGDSVSTEDCEWYEREFLSSMDNLWAQEKNSREIDSMLRAARNKVNE